MRAPRSTFWLMAATGVAAAVLGAPSATAQPDTSNLPACTSVAGNVTTGTSTTECATPGNVQLNATPPVEPVYPYPWDDEFYGPALIIGGVGTGGGAHGGGGR
jgi:hypothetical protein